jgi:hypothetical protein
MTKPANMARTKATKPPAAMAKQVRYLVEQTSVKATAQALGFAQSTICRLAARQPVQPGIILLCERALEQLAA